MRPDVQRGLVVSIATLAVIYAGSLSGPNPLPPLAALMIFCSALIFGAIGVKIVSVWIGPYQPREEPEDDEPPPRRPRRPDPKVLEILRRRQEGLPAK